MTDKELENAVKEALTEYIDEYIPISDADFTPHDFSPEFEVKMQKLIDSIGKHKYISRKKLIACIIAAIIAACAAAMSVSAVRELFINFITNVFETHTEVQSVADDTAPLEFSDIYEITADMSGYKLTDMSEDAFEREYIYENEYCTIYFRQYIKEYYDISENTEGYDMEETYINGCEGYYIDMYGSNAKKITWDNGDYIISIFALYDDSYKFNKSSLIDMANSVQKVDS